jgi:hypothetical protein
LKSASQEVSNFIPVASQLNVVARFARAGRLVTLAEDGRLFCLVFLEKEKYLFNPSEVAAEPVQTDQKIAELEVQFYLEHITQIIRDEMPPIIK